MKVVAYILLWIVAFIAAIFIAALLIKLLDYLLTRKYGK